MLHVTNGESAAAGLRAARLPGVVLTWDDVLHDGPVPAAVSFNQLRAIRARFISDSGWATFDDALRKFADRDRALEAGLREEEIVLWFEHDLFDQLQLLQLLDWFATCELGATALSLVCDAEYLGPSTPERLAERFPSRVRVTDEQFDLARTAWRAFRAGAPTEIETLLAAGTSALPFLGTALARHLEQFPSTVNGLSRTEQQALERIALGPCTVGDAFTACADREAAAFLGNLSFAAYVGALGACTHPLVLNEHGSSLAASGPSQGRSFWLTSLRLSDAGGAVLTGKADHVRLNGIDRWYGGVHLEGDDAEWRWNPHTKRIEHREVER